MAKQALAAAR
jgi:excisionase family DNA binding protein